MIRSVICKSTEQNNTRRRFPTDFLTKSFTPADVVVVVDPCTTFTFRWGRSLDDLVFEILTPDRYVRNCSGGPLRLSSISNSWRRTPTGFTCVECSDLLRLNERFPQRGWYKGGRHKLSMVKEYVLVVLH